MKRTTATTTDLKLINRNKVYQYIYEQDKVSKQDLVAALGLSLPTVSQNLTELFDMGLLCYSGTFESSGGRKAKKISVISDARMVIGVEIKMTHINLLDIDLKGNPSPIKRLEIAFEANDRYGELLAAEIDRYVEERGLDPEIILGVGISIPGVLSEDKGQIINAPTLKARYVPIESLTKFIKYDTYIENDANASAFAEQNSRKDLTTLAFLSVSEGVGGALIYNGSAYIGMNNRGAEFGHMSVVSREGKPCACGKKGCLEAYISTSVLASEKDQPVDVFFEKLKEGDDGCAELWNDYLLFLCMGINNIRTIFDCDIILGGTLARYLGDSFDDIKERLIKIAVFDSTADYLHLSNYRSNASGIGTALHFAVRFIKSV
ncbi:ROK family transcriptional regulator [Anoxybacterium hadale]|uniref:ROK family transcriptional regulator n=1 Tax=Anoxybacterium hadale TaxID=3408580 RepID=A0ACD1AET7_9FIRM|nr:ROK family transcriptional regulator [Clostridiales bacterium]